MSTVNVVQQILLPLLLLISSSACAFTASRNKVEPEFIQEKKDVVTICKEIESLKPILIQDAILLRRHCESIKPTFTLRGISTRIHYYMSVGFPLTTLDPKIANGLNSVKQLTEIYGQVVVECNATVGFLKEDSLEYAEGYFTLCIALESYRIREDCYPLVRVEFKNDWIVEVLEREL